MVPYDVLNAFLNLFLIALYIIPYLCPKLYSCKVIPRPKKESPVYMCSNFKHSKVHQGMQLPQANLNSMVSKYHMTLKSHTQDILRGPFKYLGPGPKGWAKWSLPFTYGCDFVNARDIQVVKTQNLNSHVISYVVTEDMFLSGLANFK
jgi:hypothetical protein